MKRQMILVLAVVALFAAATGLLRSHSPSTNLKGKTIAASAPGTAPYFTLAWMLRKNGLAVYDVTVVNLEPAAAAQAFVSGHNDAAKT